MAGEQNGLTLSFSNSRATFPYALPNKVGVGDVIQYDTVPDQTPDALVFIHERISDTEFRIAKVDGTPMNLTTDTKTWGVLRAYTSLYDAVTMEENLSINALIWDFDDILATDNPRDLVARNTVWNIACYADGVDDTLVSIHFWVTDESHYLRIFTPVGPPDVGEGTSQRHSGIWTTDAYRLEVSFDADDRDVIQVNSDCVHIDGLQIHKTSENGPRPIQGIEIHGTTRLWLSNCIIRGDGSNGQGVFLESADAELYMWNTIIYKTAETSGDGIFLGAGARAFIYNVTHYNNNRGIYVAGNAGTNLFVKNVIAVGNVGTSSYDFDSDATFGLGSTNNCSSDATAGGGGMSDGIVDVAPEDVFERHTSDPPDLHLKSDSLCNGAGANLTSDPDLSFQKDIDGNPRPTGVNPWDIGADENGL